MALALPGEALACKGHKGDKADANNDGFLTAAEVGDKRWARIQVADANNDGQISKAEFDQAKKDGTIGKRKKKNKNKGKAEA